MNATLAAKRRDEEIALHQKIAQQFKAGRSRRAISKALKISMGRVDQALREALR